MVTLKQLSKELGVSISTVSKALSDSFEISEKTKNRVLELAKKYNYIPNTTAVNLRSKSTKTIGVIIPNIFNHFYTKILSGIEKEAKKNGYKIVVSISNEELVSEREGVIFFSNRSVDGILLAPSDETEKSNNYAHIVELRNKNIPFVVFDRHSGALQADKVIINDFDSAKNAIKYFLSKERKQILVVSLLKNLKIGKLRMQGALSAFEELEILEFDNEDELLPVLKDTLQTKNIDAVLSLDELSGIISLNIIRTLNIKIPDEISIISFSQGILSKYSYPKLSTINQHAETIGEESLKLLLSRLKYNNKSSYSTKIIKTELEVNQT